MSRPLYTHMVNNVVFGATLHDAWAVYKLRNCSYPGLTLNRKIDVKEHLEGFAYRVSADFQVLRVSREWSVEQYLAGALRTMDSRRGHQELWRGYLEQHQHVLEGNNTARPESYLAVRLRDANINLADSLSRSVSEGWKSVVRELAAYLQLSDPKSLSAEQLHNLMRVESRTFERIWGYVDCERCSTNDLQWLVRRAYTRGLGEPLVEELWAPQAIEFPDGDGPDRYTASRAEMLRLHDSLIDTTNPRRLLVRSELGDSYQAVLAVGTLPETTVFPGSEAELMFAPLEGLEFPIDMTFTASWIPNKSAIKTAHRKKIDADNQYEEETYGHHGPSPDSEERPKVARELEAHLTANDRPPMLRGAITVIVGAPDPEILEERVERVRSEFGRIRLYRAPARQYELFCSTLPCQPFPVEDYREHLTIEQFAAMVPHACNRAGSEVGPYIGHTLTGSRQPILLDLSEASQSSLPPTVLALATLGAGKTMFAQKVAYEAFLCGSRVVDIDPKGDHNFKDLPGVTSEVHEEIVIGAGPQYRGLLDPLRISPPDLVFDLTVSWLTDLLPSRHDDRVLAVQEAVKRVIAERNGDGRGSSCWEVINVLEAEENEAAQGAARALRIHADQGFAQAGVRAARGAAGAVGAQAGRDSACAQPAPAAGKRASGDDPGRGDQPRRAAPARRLRDAGDERRAQAAQGVARRRGMVAFAECDGRRTAARATGQVGPLGERHPDLGRAHGHRRARAGKPDRRDLLLRPKDRRGGPQSADPARPRPRGLGHATATAEVSRRPLHHARLRGQHRADASAPRQPRDAANTGHHPPPRTRAPGRRHARPGRVEHPWRFCPGVRWAPPAQRTPGQNRRGCVAVGAASIQRMPAARDTALALQHLRLGAPLALILIAAGLGAALSSPPGAWAATKQTAPKSTVAPAREAPAAATSGESGSDANPNGSLVGTDVLNLSNPACSSSVLTVWQAGRCVLTGDPDVAYPVGNFQFDIHINTGITHPINNIYAVIETNLNTIWLILLYLLKYTLTMLSWAFSLAPFTNNSTLGNVHSKLTALYSSLDTPWLNAVYVLVGTYAAYSAFVRRRQSEAIGHLLASLVCILAALAIINDPAYFIGKPAGFANSLAQNAIAASDMAALNKTASNPTSRFAGLTATLFSAFAMGPFCALETNDVTWCESPPSHLEIKTVQAAVSGDKPFQEQARAIAVEAASRLPASQQKAAYTDVYDSLTTTSTAGLSRADLFLRYPLGSTPRDALYALYSGQNPDSGNPEGNIIASIISGAKSIIADASKGEILAVAGDALGTAASLTLHLVITAVTTPIGPLSPLSPIGSATELAGILGIGGEETQPKALAPNKVAIQGSGGVAQRVLVLGLAVLAMAGVLLVLVWIAFHLLSQALLGFVLLFAAAPMMLMPAFGPSGRAAFGSWAKTLFGAILSKAFYAAFLGAFVLSLTALQQATGTPGNGGWGAPWVMQCLLCWGVFMKRKQIVGFFSIDPAYHAQSGSAGLGALRVFGAAYAASRLGGMVAGQIKRPIRNARINSIERRMAQDTATSELASDMLSRQETDGAQREFTRAEQHAGIYQRALDKTGLRLDRLKQNPDYRQLVQHQASTKAYRELRERPGGAGPGVTPPAPLPPDVQARGGVIRAQIDKLQAGRSTLQKRHAQAQGIVNTGQRNLAQHNSVLSPAEPVKPRRGTPACIRASLPLTQMRGNARRTSRPSGSAATRRPGR